MLFNFSLIGDKLLTIAHFSMLSSNRFSGKGRAAKALAGIPEQSRRVKITSY